MKTKQFVIEFDFESRYRILMKTKELSRYFNFLCLIFIMIDALQKK